MVSKFVVVRIRGKTGLNKKLNMAMETVKLYNKHHCVILDNNKAVQGILQQIKDYSTWGELNEETFNELLTKRGKLPGNKPLTEAYVNEKLKISINEFSKEFLNSKKKLKDIPGLKTFFRLLPPKGGFERGGIKTPFSLGGVLGYRGEKINKLIKNML